MTQFMIFANADDKNTMDVMYTLDRRVRTFAIDNHADYRAVNVNEYKVPASSSSTEGVEYDRHHPHPSVRARSPQYL